MQRRKFYRHTTDVLWSLNVASFFGVLVHTVRWLPAIGPSSIRTSTRFKPSGPSTRQPPSPKCYARTLRCTTVQEQLDVIRQSCYYLKAVQVILSYVPSYASKEEDGAVHLEFSFEHHARSHEHMLTRQRSCKF